MKRKRNANETKDFLIKKNVMSYYEDAGNIGTPNDLIFAEQKGNFWKKVGGFLKNNGGDILQAGANFAKNNERKNNPPIERPPVSFTPAPTPVPEKGVSTWVWVAVAGTVALVLLLVLKKKKIKAPVASNVSL